MVNSSGLINRGSFQTAADAEVFTLQQRHHSLQVVTLLAGDTHLIALGLTRYTLWTFFFDQLVDLFCLVSRDANFHSDHLTHGVARGLFKLAPVDSLQRQTALHESFFQQDTNGTCLLFRNGLDGDDEVVLLDGGVGPLEIETIDHFALGLVDSVAELLAVNFGNNVERWHGVEG